MLDYFAYKVTKISDFPKTYSPFHPARNHRPKSGFRLKIHQKSAKIGPH
jgi:hypothetical protein